VRTNAVYLNTGGIAGTNSPLDPGNPINGYPAVDGNFGPNYDSAATIVLGIFPEGDGHYNFARDGSALPQGKPINRRYAINDYEFFGQDTWRLTPRLTVTYGLRWVLEAPPYETNGYQVAPCVAAAGGGCTKQMQRTGSITRPRSPMRAMLQIAPENFLSFSADRRIMVRACGTGTIRIFHRVSL